MFQHLLCLLIGYGFGCILTAEIVSYGKSNKSIRTQGSGNPGMTNTLRIYGIKYGVLVLIGDLSKTFLACFLSNALFPTPSNIAILYAGLGTIIGHNFPFWNGFHGGKGVASTCIVLFYFSPLLGLLSCILGLIVSLLTKFLALGALTIPAVFLLGTICFYDSIEIQILSLFLLFLMIQRHVPSLKSIAHGTEKKALWLDK